MFNATCLNARPSGEKQRFAGIYGALFKRLQNVEFAIFEPRDCRVAEWFAGQPNVLSRSTSIPSTGQWGKLAAALAYWPKVFGSESFDTFEVMHLPLFRPTRGKTVLTIHDIRDLYQQHATMNRTVYRTVLRHALQRSDHVVTVSETIRSEILDFYPHTPVSVVYNGFDMNAFSGVTQAHCETFSQKYKLPQEFIFAVGHLEKRKNYPRLIDAVKLLKQRGLDCPLVIVGNDSGEGAALA